MNFVTEINQAEFDGFVSAHTSGHYMKTALWGKYKSSVDHQRYFTTGLRDENHRLIACAMVLEEKRLYGLLKLHFVPWGICADTTDTLVSDRLYRELIAFAKRRRVAFLRISPNVLRKERDLDGHEIIDGENNEALTAQLISLGFNHKGYGYAYDGSWLNRYTLILDITPKLDEIIAQFEKSKRNLLIKQKTIGMTSRYGRDDELTYLVEFGNELADKLKFKPKQLSYFSELKKQLGDSAVFIVSELDMNVLIHSIDVELRGRKFAKDPEALASKQKERTLTLDLANRYGPHPVIAAGLFITLGDKCWNVYTYNAKEFAKYVATDNLHEFAIGEMQKRGISSYDMVGFSGVIDKKDAYYGLYSYKRSFFPTFIEYIGEFDYVINSSLYSLFKKTEHLGKRIRRKISTTLKPLHR